MYAKCVVFMDVLYVNMRVWAVGVYVRTYVCMYVCMSVYEYMICMYECSVCVCVVCTFSRWWCSRDGVRGRGVLAMMMCSRARGVSACSCS